MIAPENTHRKGKYYCMSGLQFNKIDFDQKENMWLLVRSEAVESNLV